MIDVGEVAEADLLGDRLVREDGFQLDPRERHRDRRILRQILAHRRDAAGALEIAAPQRHDLADAEAKAKRRGAEEKPRMGVDDRGFDQPPMDSAARRRATATTRPTPGAKFCRKTASASGASVMFESW